MTALDFRIICTNKILKTVYMDAVHYLFILLKYYKYYYYYYITITYIILCC